MRSSRSFNSSNHSKKINFGNRKCIDFGDCISGSIGIGSAGGLEFGYVQRSDFVGDCGCISGYHDSGTADGCGFGHICLVSDSIFYCRRGIDESRRNSESIDRTSESDYWEIARWFASCQCGCSHAFWSNCWFGSSSSLSNGRDFGQANGARRLSQRTWSGSEYNFLYDGIDHSSVQCVDCFFIGIRRSFCGSLVRGGLHSRIAGRIDVDGGGSSHGQNQKNTGRRKHIF